MTTDRFNSPADEGPWLIVGLGNPGSAYALTRHNMGFLVAERWAQREGMTFKAESRFAGKIAQGVTPSGKALVLLPTTYMNGSGQAVQSVVAYFKVSLFRILVVADDVALEFGKVRLRAQGTPGGHNGLKSVEAHLKTNRYCRLKMGVGSGRAPLKDHVLGRFSASEQQALDTFIDDGVDAVDLWMRQGVDRAMNVVNTSPAEAVNDKENN